MFQAQYLFKGNVVLSPWMERGGDNLVITLDLVAQSQSTCTIKVEVLTKAKDIPGDGTTTPMTGAIETDSLGQTNKEFTGANELVRYRFTSGNPTNPEDYDYVLFRMLNVTWFDDVAV
jgi:hypothetical protein